MLTMLHVCFITSNFPIIAPNCGKLLRFQYFIGVKINKCDMLHVHVLCQKVLGFVFKQKLKSTIYNYKNTY